MANKAERDLSRIGWLDYVLMSVCSCLAVYSAGMSINQPSISYFCVILVLLGAGVSYGVRVLSINSPWIKLDAVFYSAAVIGAIFFSTELRMIMPEGGFPREMGAAGWLTWMLILGSFATWQDSTLLFQAIPALALFGLIGCYETYKGATLAFFGFLICLATLFARAHGREMLRKAAESGYFTRGLAPGTPIPSVETTPGLALQLKKGPWRWVAGPEWALASAVAVVLISLLGAPVIRESVTSVGGGFVRLNQPSIRPRFTPAAPAAADVTGNSVRIGRPFQKSLPRSLFEVGASLAGTQYLRSEVYDTYTGQGWQNTFGFSDQKVPADSPLASLGQTKLTDGTPFTFKIHLLRYMHLLPLPPDTLSVKVDDGGADLLTDGTWQLQNAPSSEIDLSGTALRPKSSKPPVSSPKALEWGSFADKSRIPARVQQLALQVSDNKKTDFDKAVAIRNEICNRIVYNLGADETPSTSDPVEYTLFEQKEGYCTAFASAMVLMARSIGIPSRYVQGYLTDDRRREQDGRYMVTEADYHAWAELYFDDFGWVTFDPTIGARFKEGEGLGDAGDPRPWYQKGVLGVVLDVAIVATVIGLLVTCVGFVRSYRKHKTLKTELDRVFITFNRRLERAAGRRRNVGQTPDEFLESIRFDIGESYQDAKDLNERFVTALYSPRAVSQAVLAELRSDLKRLSGKLKAEQARHSRPQA